MEYEYESLDFRDKYSVYVNLLLLASVMLERIEKEEDPKKNKVM